MSSSSLGESHESCQKTSITDVLLMKASGIMCRCHCESFQSLLSAGVFVVSTDVMCFMVRCDWFSLSHTQLWSPWPRSVRPPTAACWLAVSRRVLGLFISICESWCAKHIRMWNQTRHPMQPEEGREHDPEMQC